MCCLGLGTIFVTARLRIFKGFFMNTFSFFLQYVGETAALINVGSCYELTVMPLCEEQRYGFKYKPCKPWLDSQTVHIGIKVTSTPLHPIPNGTRANTIVSVQTSSSFVGIVLKHCHNIPGVNCQELQSVGPSLRSILGSGFQFGEEITQLLRAK